jgi:uncharacterized protein (DUF58 family)
MLLLIAFSVFTVQFDSNFIYLVAILVFLFLGALVYDILHLFTGGQYVEGKRIVRSQLSLGDEQPVKYYIENKANKSFRYRLKDYLPFQLNMLKHQIKGKMGFYERIELQTIIRPVRRGEYIFDALEIFLEAPFRMMERRMVLIDQKQVCNVYPSQIQLSKYSLANIKNTQMYYGVKKVRKIGHSYEFDHIKHYVMGDDVRSINWKATSRRNELMINHYEDEKSQAVYCILDKSRVMNMPFHQMSLLDYSINAALVISNNALQYQDRAGLITFSDVLGKVLPASKSSKQLGNINEALFKQKHRNTEANYELLHYSIKKLTRKRTLFFLFTNFENQNSLERQLPVLLRIAKRNLLVLIVFKNKETEEFTYQSTGKVDVYENAVAHKYLSEKERMVKKLRAYGIRCIYTYPEELTINTLNEYIFLKSTGRI